MTFAAPISLALGLMIVAITTIVWLKRRPEINRAAVVLAYIGSALLALACGGPAIQIARPIDVVVMVDCSPSTRGAEHRQTGQLIRRLDTLLGQTPYRVIRFADANRPEVRVAVATEFEEINCAQTVFAPLPADAILLFSDGQFQLPDISPPVYPIIDPQLDAARDAAVTRIESRGRQLAATIRNSGEPRRLTMTGVRQAPAEPIGKGKITILADPQPSASRIVARLSNNDGSADAWPENDELVMAPVSPTLNPNWWIGARSPPGNWKQLTPSALPENADAYLLPSAIILDNVPDDAISAQAQRRLEQYVRDLGGTLLIVGGPQAFAAGGYAGSTIESLSPLSSDPPQPTTHWIILLDASGSMAAPNSAPPGSSAGESGGTSGSRWQFAVDAMRGIVPLMPPDDLVSIASFAKDVNWWIVARSARETAATALPPPDLSPRGPTNLQPALEQIIANAAGTAPTEVLIVSDADARIDDPAALATKLSAARVRAHLLSIGNTPATSAVPQVVQATGGKIIAQPDAAKWSSDLRKLMRSAAPDQLSHEPARVAFVKPLNLPDRIIAPWNHTWPKSSADPIATATFNDLRVAMAAKHAVGLGQVVAMAFAAETNEVEAMVREFAAVPRDPRLRVTWDCGSQLRVNVDAIEADRFINHLDLHVQLTDQLTGHADPRSLKVPQIAPGRYELTLPAPRSPQLATLTNDGKLIDRTAVAGRYAQEFDAIGNDRATLRELAQRSSGRMIEPGEISPLDLHRPQRSLSLTSLFAITGCLLIAAGLIQLRRMQ